MHINDNRRMNSNCSNYNARNQSHYQRRIRVDVVLYTFNKWLPTRNEKYMMYSNHWFDTAVAPSLYNLFISIILEKLSYTKKNYGSELITKQYCHFE